MDKISLVNPVVVSFAEDTPEKAREVITDLVKFRKCLRVKEGEICIEDIQNEARGSITGIEGAKALCWLLEIPFRSVEQIDVDDIVAKCDDMNSLLDIFYLICRVIARNDRLAKMLELGVPETIIRNECRMLQDAAEQLAHNCTSENPITRNTDEGEESLASLCCIGYEL